MYIYIYNYIYTYIIVYMIIYIYILYIITYDSWAPPRKSPKYYSNVQFMVDLSPHGNL